MLQKMLSGCNLHAPESLRDNVMDNTQTSTNSISHLEEKVNILIVKILQPLSKDCELSNNEVFHKLETELHQVANELADTITGIKLQQHLDKAETKNDAKDLIKAQATRMKNMGLRIVNIRMLGGTVIPISTEYYHRKVTLKKHRGLRGIYPGLLLLGIMNHHSPGLESLISLLATAASSFAEATQLIKETLGFNIDVKTMRKTVKRFSERARACIELERFTPPDDFTGRTVAASTDGGRIRIRTNKRGKKTKKGRTRYKTDWREPKLIIIYVIGEEGKKERSTLPIMDATLNGPDETFGLLVFYLKKLKVNAADLLIFLSDGAKWIWERAKNIASMPGFQTDFTHYRMPNQL